MKFTSQALVFALVSSSVHAHPLAARDASDADIARLAPDLGFSSGVNPTGTGDCDGAVNGPNGPIKIPCFCPPSRDDFLQHLKADVHAGHAVNNPSVSVSFPTDDSTGSQIARIQASLIALQNLRGPGQGCPAVSTTLLAQQSALQNGGPPPPPNTPPPPPPPAQNVAAPPPSNNNNGGDDIERLAPPLGFPSGLNPTGTGDCDGAVNGPNGQAIKIPCACPPSQDVYINALRANVQAGHAVNNPGVGVSFPTDNSKDSQIARIQAALVTLQNLKGPGVGCPAVSTTLLAQQTAVQNGSPPPPPFNPAPAQNVAAPPPPPPSNNNNNGGGGGDDVARLAPPLGFSAGLNPTGTGDCDGAVSGPNGPIKIPCSCPPSQEDFVKALRANVQAGHAVNNPGVSVSFGTGNSKEDQISRIQAGLITLQNLKGPGVGCPAVSSTLSAQLKALTG